MATENLSYKATILRSAITLGLFAVLGVGLLSYIQSNTFERIRANQREALLANLNDVLPHDRYNNHFYQDTITITSPSELGTKEPITVYRARMDNKPVAVVFSPIAPDGYSGSIKLLVGINYDGSLSGVRVLVHRETPGLGDRVETKRSNWILNFNGKSLQQPRLEQWQVKPDGGDFDAFTGATITPRAVVKAVKKSLLYYQREKNNLFKQQNTPNG